MSKKERIDMKLCIELVPKSLWYANPRTTMGRPKWDKLRKEVYAQYGHVCGVCGAQGRRNCHAWTADWGAYSPLMEKKG